MTGGDSDDGIRVHYGQPAKKTRLQAKGDQPAWLTAVVAVVVGSTILGCGWAVTLVLLELIRNRGG